MSFAVEQEITLLPFIMSSLKGVSRSHAKAVLAGGGVCVDGRPTKQFDEPLQPGQTVTIDRRPRATLTNKYVSIVYEDADIVVVEKQPGILSMATSHHSFCIKSVLDEYFHRSKQSCAAHVVHRLDRETSGLLVYAKNLKAERILEHNWHEIVTDRRYVALVSGEMQPGLTGDVGSWLKDNKAYYTHSYTEDPGGAKYALTHYRVLDTGRGLSLVELKLATGRKNQIRVHMLDLGHPVCGDTKYGDGTDPVGRLCLHAFRLNFYHPITGRPLSFETPVPKLFLKALGLDETSPKRQKN